jgi:translation initiation factor 3 subunit L
MNLSAAIPAYQQPGAARAPDDESDAEEDALVNDYKEQVQYEDGLEELDRSASINSASIGAGGGLDISAQLAQAATPLDYQATLETKFQSYDNYCSLFHYILNSEGPVDLEVPTVGKRKRSYRDSTNSK